MGENTRRVTKGDHDAEQVPWMRALKLYSAPIAIPALILGFLGVLAVLALIFFNKTNFTWVPNLISLSVLCLILGFITLFFKLADSAVPGIVALIIGAAFYSGVSFLIGILGKLGHVDPKDVVMQSAIDSLRGFGFLLMICAVARLVVVFIGYATNQQRATTTRLKYMDVSKDDTQKISFVPRCWQMSRCRPAVRMSCPNYIDRKTCWSRRSGCFCDRDLANYLIQSVDKGESTEVTEVAQAAMNTKGYAGRGAKRPWKLQKTLCYNCPLFIEHQEYKFNHMRWISLPMTLFIGLCLYVPFDMGFTWFSTFLSDQTTRLVNQWGLQETVKPEATTLGPGFELFLGVVLLILISSYVMAFTEKMFLKWNL